MDYGINVGNNEEDLNSMCLRLKLHKNQNFKFTKSIYNTVLFALSV